MMGRGRLLMALVAVEFAVGAAALAWRLSLPAVPLANLARLPEATAGELKRLQIAASRNRADAWIELGEAYLAYGYFPQAEACLRHATRSRPGDFRAAYAHAYSLDRLCRLAEAEAAFEAAANLTRGQRAGNCWYHIGLCRLRRDHPAQAEQALLRAGDGYAPAVHLRARLMLRSGRTGEATMLLESLRKELNLDVQTEMLAVQIFRETGQEGEMYRAEERAERSQLKLRMSDHWEYLHPIRSRYGLMGQYSQAQELVAQGRIASAARSLQSLLETSEPDHTDGFWEQGAHLLLLEGRVEQAEEILARFGNRMALSPAALHLMGDVRRAQNRIDEASRLWKAANRLRPDSHSLRSLAALRSREGAASAAAIEDDRALLIDGIRAYRANELETAGKALEQAQRSLKDEAPLWFYLGETNLALSRLEQARSAWQTCAKTDPDHGRALERLAQFPR